MFIKPLDLATLPSALYGLGAWADCAGNEHFVLQSRKSKGPAAQLLSGLLRLPSALLPGGSSPSSFSAGGGTGTGGVAPSATANSGLFKELLEQSDYRILLRCVGRKTLYLVCLEDGGMEKIRPPWNWIERELLPKVEDAALSPDQRDSILLRHLDQLAAEVGDPRRNARLQAKLYDMSAKLALLFRGFRRGALLDTFPAILLTMPPEELAMSAPGAGIPVTGTLCLAVDELYFHAEAGQSFTLAYREVCGFACSGEGTCTLHMTGSVEGPRVTSGGAASSPGPGLGYAFCVTREVCRLLGGLIQAALVCLAKGADYATSTAMDMFDKGHQATGDLGSGGAAKKSGLLSGTQAKSEFGAGGLDGGSGYRRSLDTLRSQEEQDFTDQLTSGTHDDLHQQHGVAAPAAQAALEHMRFSRPPEAYTTLAPTPFALTMDGVASELAHIEFRQLFHLSHLEVILFHEPQVVYFHQGTFYTGNLYLSANFLCFAAASTATSTSGLGAGGSGAGGAASTSGDAPSLSALNDMTQDLALSFVIPLPQIVSVSKQSPTSLPTSGLTKFTGFAISGYLVISIFKVEFWLCFPAPKVRDRVSEEILTKMKAVEGDMMRDYGLSQQSAASPLLSAEAIGEEGAVDAEGESRSPAKAATGIVPRGLLFMDRGPGMPLTGALSAAEEFWGTLLKGRVLPYPATRAGLATHPIPARLRGPLWLWWSGAQHCKPSPDYYRTLLAAHASEASPFAEEVEKDVPRSLPEHPAYQSPVGLGALRRVLLQYSWRNPGIGYTQAFNLIASLLLLYLREEDAFAVLCEIVEHRHPDHYTKTLVGSLVDQDVFARLVQHHLPALHRHLDKIYLDLTTVSVPWFLCLFLNTVPYEVGILFLDAFLLDSTRFLLWAALAVLKLNEPALLATRDDEQAMRCLKEYFASLREGLTIGHQLSGVMEELDGEPAMMSPALQQLLTQAYQYAPLVTPDVLAYLRLSSRCRVVAGMEATNRKVQVRNVQEQVRLTQAETELLYEHVRASEYHRECLFDRNRQAMQVRQEEAEFERVKQLVLDLGAWNFSHAVDFTFQQRGRHKSIALRDFRALFERFSLWGCRREAIGAGVLALPDRVYFYLSLQYNYLLHSKRQNVRVGEAVGERGEEEEFTVDLAAVAHYLDTIMKAPLNARLRFLFDLHDVNGDGSLGELELKAAMDTLLGGLFDRDLARAESYLMAISHFVASAYSFVGGGASAAGDSTGAGAEGAGLSPPSVAAGTGPSRSRSFSVSARPPVSSSAFASSVTTAAGSKLGEAGTSTGHPGYRLNFNEFLLAMLSQPVFVQFFEGTWVLMRPTRAPTREEGAEVLFARSEASSSSS